MRLDSLDNIFLIGDVGRLEFNWDVFNSLDDIYLEMGEIGI